MGTSVLAAMLLGCAATPNVTTNQLPLKRVVVYRNGVGYFERRGHVDADEVKFKMRGRMVGDFLATLAIVEAGGSTVRSASFPLDVVDDDPPPDPAPEITSMLKPWPNTAPKPDEPDPDALKEVVLRLDGKEHDLAVGYVSETPVWRPSYRVVVRPDGSADLQAWGIVQNLSGEDWDAVRMVLVAGAPLAFQSTLGDPVIPTRPVVTDTGEVIAAVPEGVTSLKEAEGPAEDADGMDGDEGGEADEDEETADEPAAAPAPKSGAYKSKPKRIASARRPSGGAGGKGDFGALERAKKREALARALTDGLSRPRSVSALAAVAVDSGTTRYVIPNRVTVPNESATMVLLLSQRVPGESVFLYSPDGGVPESASHPFRVARFENATKGLLERGPIAVFEKGSFLGQGMLDPLPPAAKATVPFALERGLAVQKKSERDTSGARMGKIEYGRLWIERDSVRRTTYTIKNGSKEPAKMLVKHPRETESRLHEPPPETEDNVGTGSALVPIAIKPYGKADLVVDERRSFMQSSDWLSALADEAVSAYLKDSKSNPAIVAKLKAAWVLRNNYKKNSDEHGKLRNEQGELIRAAREWRLSLKAIEKNKQAADLRRDLERRLKENTSRQEVVTKRLIQLQMAVDTARIRFREAIRTIKLNLKDKR